MADRLFDENPSRILNIVDCVTREAIATAARTKFRAFVSIAALQDIFGEWECGRSEWVPISAQKLWKRILKRTAPPDDFEQKSDIGP